MRLKPPANGLLGAAAALQVPAEISGRLPFWLFWLLLCVIVLLLAVIFLRDKALRRRLSSFLSGTRRRMIRLRLQAKLKRELEKKALLWKDLGKKAWSEDIAASCIAEESAKLAALEEEMHVHQMAWHEIYSRIERLGRDHEQRTGSLRAAVREQEETRKPFDEERTALGSRKAEILDAIGGAAWEADAAEGQLKALDREARAAENNAKMPDIEKAARLNKIQEKAAVLTDRAAALQRKLPLLHDERRDLERRQAEAESRSAVFESRIAEIQAERESEERAHERELREWLRNKERVQDKIVEIQRLMEPLFERIGRRLDEKRLDQNDLPAVYFQIDAVNRTISEIEHRIERLQ